MNPFLGIGLLLVVVGVFTDAFGGASKKKAPKAAPKPAAAPVTPVPPANSSAKVDD